MELGGSTRRRPSVGTLGHLSTLKPAPLQTPRNCSLLDITNGAGADVEVARLSMQSLDLMSKLRAREDELSRQEQVIVALQKEICNLTVCMPLVSPMMNPPEQSASPSHLPQKTHLPQKPACHCPHVHSTFRLQAQLAQIQRERHLPTSAPSGSGGSAAPVQRAMPHVPGSKVTKAPQSPLKVHGNRLGHSPPSPTNTADETFTILALFSD